MLLTKHAAELLALLVNDLFGELPSRILAALLTKGRSTIAQLTQHTSLSSRHLRNGLGVLIQHNLLFYSTDPDSSLTSYEANCDACYNLVRSGKILEVIEQQYGLAERDLMQTLLLLGYAKVADLIQAFTSRAPVVNGHSNGTHEAEVGLIDTESHLNAVLSSLIQAEVVETINPGSFRNPAEIYREIEAEITKTEPGEKSTKNKVEQHLRVVERFRAFRDQNTALKRQLDQSCGPALKKRRLRNGLAHAENASSGDSPKLHPNTVVRVNHEKCLVHLRNWRLVDFAEDALGEVTAQVYRALLQLLTAQFPRCRPDPLLDDAIASRKQVTVTTVELFEHLDEDVNVFSGIGKAPKDKIDFRSAEKIIPLPPVYDDDSEGSSDSDAPMHDIGPLQLALDEDEVSGHLGEDEPVKGRPLRSATRVNGSRPTKVQFQDEADARNDRLDQMRRHLLLLAESKNRFVRHCGSEGRGQWTVDFDQLIGRLREFELDGYIEQSFGRYGLRLTRILREKGKLDEKMLPSAALMKKSDVQEKMLAMQMSGLVDVQEVPKDNSRLANRTLFFWHFDGERIQSRLLDDIYKAMLRCLETLQAQRHKERNILAFVERKDVKGKEEEVMTAEHYNQYNRHLEQQEMLMGQIMRLDGMIAVFRDY